MTDRVVHPWRELRSGAGAVFAVALVLAVCPMVVGVAQALDAHWVPFGDEAALGVRAADVFSAETPLLGMPTGVIADDQVANHPGPLLFWLDAPFVTAFGSRVGLLVAAAALNIGAAVAIGLMTFRREGIATAIGALVAVTLLVASLFGSGTIFRPFNPQVVLLALLLLLFLCWWTAAGEQRLLPAVVVVASLVVQSDLAFLPVVVAAVATACGGLLVIRRPTVPNRPHLPSLPQGNGALRLGHAIVIAGVVAGVIWVVSPPVVIVLALAVVVVLGLAGVIALAVWWWRLDGVTWWITNVVVAACWIAPLVEAVANDGGNVRRLWGLLRVPTEVQGPEYALRSARAVLSFPPLVFGHLYEDRFLASIWWPAVLVGVAWAGLLWWALRHRRTSESRLLLVAGIATAAGAIGAARVPTFEGWVPQHLNWLLVLSAFLWFALVRVGLLAALSTTSSDRVARRARVVAMATSLVVLVLITFPRAAALIVPVPNDLPRTLRPHFHYENWLYDAVPALAQPVVEAVDPRGRYLVLPAGGRPYWEAANGLIAQLEERGVPTATENLVHYYGHARDARVVALAGSLAVGPAGLDDPPAGGRLVASYRPPGWDPERIEALGADVERHVRSTGPLRLTPAGVAGLRDAVYGFVPGACQPARWSHEGCGSPRRLEDDPDRLLDLPPVVLLGLYREGDVASPALPPSLQARLDRDFDALAVDVYLAPPQAR